MHVSSITARAASIAVAATAVVTLAVSAPAGATGTPSTAKVVAIHEAMDKLWTDHVTWTKIVIDDFATGAPSLKPDLARLLQNQADIGDAIKPYYGNAAGTELASLLHTHIMEAVPVLAAAKAGNKAKLSKALKTWYANGHQIAAFLSKANPHAWPLSATQGMMSAHLALTTNEAVAVLKHDWSGAITAYDRVRDEILMMADTLANGLVAQFPARFS